MARKRKRPIGPTGTIGEEAAQQQASIAAQGGGGSVGGGKHHQVEMEGEDVELQQEISPNASDFLSSRPDTPENELPRIITPVPEVPPEVEDEFRQAVRSLPPERQTESMRKRKRAA